MENEKMLHLKPSNMLLVANTQQQDAALRRMLHAGQRQRWTT